MLHFKSLRLSGFKSFIDKTELEIGPGLTGIVGPNGCGKSNLVEALRWTMGESSAKKMRGGGMEDVIFAGTEKRPTRNFAEVILTLDNSSRSAPSGYNTLEDIQISRKIVRDQGSAYRINGRPARARDVQLLFADTLSGANSPSMVSQGKVASIINAKPLQRRMILEESAGITGLYARRHEAELRLKQAEQNLQRIEDTTGSMESRLSALKRQARQAMRYKQLSKEIREIEQLIAYLEWRGSEEQLIAYKKEFDAFETDVSEHMATVAQLNKTYLTQTEDVPKLREAEAKLSAHIQKLKLDLQRIEDREEQRTNAIEEAKRQSVQIVADIEHSRKELLDYKETLARTASEQEKIVKESEQNEGVLKTRQTKLSESEDITKALEEKYNAAMADFAAREERQKSLYRQVEDLKTRVERLDERISQQKQKTKDLEEQKQDFQNFGDQEKAYNALLKKLEDLVTQSAKIEGQIQKQEEQESKARQELQEISLKKSKLESEISTLKDFIESFSEDDHKAVLNDMSANAGFEAALSRALGDSLQASLDREDTTYWVEYDRKLEALPKGVTSLKDVVKAPKALHLALSQIGLVDSVEQAEELLPKLSQGQSLVSKEGHYWRWDGFCVKAEAQDKQSLFLKQKNRLSDLEKDLPALVQQLEKAEKQAEELRTSIQELQNQNKELLSQKEETERQRQTADKDISAVKIRQENLEKDMQSASETLEELLEDQKQVQQNLQEQEKLLASLTEFSQDEKKHDVQDLKSRLDEARVELQNNISALERIQAQQNSRKARERALADERITLQNRIIRGEEHLTKQEERSKEIIQKLKDLEVQPEQPEQNKDTYLTKISELEGERNVLADKLATKETESAETAKALKEAESALGTSRENRARIQALLEAANATQQNIVSRIQERFETSPKGLLDQIGQVEEYSDNSLEQKREQKQELLRSREAIGPVNLQAEQEAEALEKDLGGLLHEKNDLIEAVDELRGGIRKLNIEARERLNIAFEHVNAHFQNLFKRLFVGGNAHLSLIDSDDPLEAGLEIFAQPPGKALQALSLMSGGEQTMASIALIFAMFLTNPAPICVLDEIDAPLDDANVDKVCDLLEEISETTKTRFLIVTHHRLTMARMDRIYGVTMAEKGVSQLISLDMQQSFSFLEEAA